jgi:hypothetical protein
MGVKNKVLKLIIVLAAVSFAGHAIAVEYDPPELPEPPESLEEMINITRRLVNDLNRLDPNTQSEMYQKKRLLIAYWVAIASDKRISNCNDTEIVGNPLGCWSLQETRKKWSNIDNKNEMIAKFAWENGAGKCEENSNVVYYILKQAGVTDTLRILWSDCWHGFVVWGVQEGADLNRPLTWNSDALVLDSWTGKVLTPSGAHNDYYIGNGGKNPLIDMTLGYDNTVPDWSSLLTPGDTPSSNYSEIPDSFRYTCNIKDENNDKSNLCEMWVKESESHKDIIIRNKEDEEKKLLLCHKKSQEDVECDIVMQNARDACTSWMNKGWLYFIQTPPYGGGKFCLTPKGVARIRGGGGGGWKHTATPLGKQCDNARD